MDASSLAHPRTVGQGYINLIKKVRYRFGKLGSVSLAMGEIIITWRWGQAPRA